MSAAQLAFTDVVACRESPNTTPNGVVSKIGETWQPSAAQSYNGTWYLKGSSGWWPATANKSVYNGNPVVIEKTMEDPNTAEPAIYLDYHGTIEAASGYSSVMDFGGFIGGIPK